ncbi:hypothetical protein [Streptomyces asiaticus]|uniref:hypothetical protein n=1 Tax=Streptomyces asiaticus TaxID=114695 RepID=UPI003F67DEDA
MDTHQAKRTACMVTRRSRGLGQVGDRLLERSVVDHANGVSMTERGARLEIRVRAI